jgi:hypothetical protein
MIEFSKNSLNSKLRTIYFYLLKYRLIWLGLIIIILFGFCIRYLAAFDQDSMLYFSQDDFDHMAYKSGFRISQDANVSLTSIFFDSYKDAHPPLRNILLNFLLKIINNIYLTRLASFIPGVLLIPASFLLGYSFFLNSDLRQRLYSGLVCSFLITNMETLILLSVESRPYSLMLLFEIMAIVSLLFVVKKKINYLIIPFYIFSIFAIFTDYSALVPIAVLNSILLFYSLWDREVKVRITRVILGSISLTLAVLFQYIQLSKFNSIHHFSDYGAEYIKVNYIHKICDIPIHLVSTFKTFFSYPGFSVPSLVKYASDDKAYVYTLTFLFAFFLLGLIYLLIKKEYLLFSLPVLTILIAITIAYLRFAPFGVGRQNVYLLPFLLIPIFSLYAFLLKTDLKPLFKVILIIALVLFPWSQGFSWSLSKTIKSFTVDTDKYLPSSSHRETFLNSGQWILNKSNSEQRIILISDLLHTRIKNYVFFTRMQMRLGSRNNSNKIGKEEKSFVNLMPKSGDFNSVNICTPFDHAFNLDSKCMDKLDDFALINDEIIFVGLNSARESDQASMRELGFSKLREIFTENEWYVDLYKNK